MSDVTNTLRVLTDSHPMQSILLVDDDPGIIQATGKILRGLGHLRFATSGSDALRLISESAPDLILLDAEMPGISGFQVFESLKATPLLADIPVIFLTSHSEEAVEKAGLEMGAADFIAKPIRPVLVKARVSTQLRLKRATDQLKQLAAIDGLTGVFNRRTFDAALEREWSSAKRSASPLALLMIDIDYFKRYNDHYGHQLGDACLVKVAQTIRDSLKRPGDTVYRYGGEEFAVLLPDTDADGAQDVSHRILNNIEGLQLPHAASVLCSHVTVSIGVSCVYGQSGNKATSPRPPAKSVARIGLPEDLIQAADSALYLAKNAGRAQMNYRPISAAMGKRAVAKPLAGH